MDGILSDYELEIVNLKNQRRFAEVQSFLARFGLSFDLDVEYTVVLRQDDRLVATGSFAGEVLRNFAVDETLQGTGLTATVVTALMQEQARRGTYHYFIFTKPDKAQLFEAMGFAEIARAEPYVALLETGLGSVHTYCESVQKETAHLVGNRAALVVNCNPFTKGHEALIRQAAGENEAVIIFVVSEDRSLFPFADRLALVREGVAGLGNVAVVPAGKYMVSAATFPAYFTREEDKVVAQTRLDITLFATRIAPELGIRTRYVGEEPYCEVTNAYNEAMSLILPDKGIGLKTIPRFAVEGDVVSASKVREALRSDDWAEVAKLVPACTYEYLRKPSTQPIIAKIRESQSRH